MHFESIKERFVTDTEDSLLRRALVGIALATPIWTFVFRSKRANFWVRMTAGAGALGSYALWARPEQHKELPTLKDMLVGVASAGGLYAIFQIGDRLARALLSGEISDGDTVVVDVADDRSALTVTGRQAVTA